MHSWWRELKLYAKEVNAICVFESQQLYRILLSRLQMQRTADRMQ